MGDVKKEIEEMLDSFDKPGVEEPELNAEDDEEKEEETPVTSTDKDEDQELSTDAPSTEVAATEAPTTDAPKDEVAELKAVIDGLRKQVEALTGKEKPNEKEPEPEPASMRDEVTVDTQDFLGEDFDPEDLTAETLNTILNKVFKAGVETANKTITEGVLRSIPDVVKANIVTLSTLSQATEKFYSENEDLKPFKRVVATVYEELASDNPDWDVAKILEEVEKETRKRLELYKKAVDKDKKGGGSTRPNTPPVPKGRHARQEKQKSIQSDLQAEIDAMNAEL